MLSEKWTVNQIIDYGLIKKAKPICQVETVEEALDILNILKHGKSFKRTDFIITKETEDFYYQCLVKPKKNIEKTQEEIFIKDIF